MRDYQAETPRRVEGRRMAALYRIADPLWKAIDAGHSQEVARLSRELELLWLKDKARRQQGV